MRRSPSTRPRAPLTTTTINLNPIAERAIRTIDEQSTAMCQYGGAPAAYWPHIINHTVNWHNAAPCAVGSSTADPHISPHQRLTFKQPSCMDLAVFGCRAVVLKPPTQGKGALAPCGWVGNFLGRSLTSIGAYDVWANGTINTSSSVLVDEDYMPWRKSDPHQPLTPATARFRASRTRARASSSKTKPAASVSN